MKYPPNYHKALKIQAALFADAVNPTTPAGYRAQVARAWDVLEDRKRIIRGKGKPKDVEATNAGAKVKPPTHANPFTEHDDKESTLGQTVPAPPTTGRENTGIGDTESPTPPAPISHISEGLG